MKGKAKELFVRRFLRWGKKSSFALDMREVNLLKNGPLCSTKLDPFVVLENIRFVVLGGCSAFPPTMSGLHVIWVGRGKNHPKNRG